jgi:hypothetical protein
MPDYTTPRPLKCQSDLFAEFRRMPCTNPVKISTTIQHLGATHLCIDCYKSYHDFGYVTPFQDINVTPVEYYDLKRELDNSRTYHTSVAWWEYYAPYHTLVGMQVPTLLRNLLVQYAGKPLTYHEICDIVAPFDKMLEECDWLGTDNGTQFNKVFTPSRRR